jgi:extradiol dioxygenase family protein
MAIIFPVPHFGVILDYDAFSAVVENAKQQSIDFLIEPRLRFKDEAGEQMTCFLETPLIMLLK